VTPELLALVVTAATVGFLHTLAGPDHTVPFVVMARARRWSLGRTAAVTALCGLGHVVGSVALGAVGIAVGAALSRMEGIEEVRGDIAAWALVAFGLAYLAYGIVQSVRGRPHTHAHRHGEGHAHAHPHTHDGEHAHVHDGADLDGHAARRALTPWVLFVVFVFGPCEPLIPLLMVPAAAESAAGVAIVTTVFGLVTIATMLAVVLPAAWGLGRVRLRGLERHVHAIAGASVTACGLGIALLGL
jgi:sulfite exporter TauE/SafE